MANDAGTASVLVGADMTQFAAELQRGVAAGMQRISAEVKNSVANLGRTAFNQAVFAPALKNADNVGLEFGLRVARATTNEVLRTLVDELPKAMAKGMQESGFSASRIFTEALQSGLSSQLSKVIQGFLEPFTERVTETSKALGTKLMGALTNAFGGDDLRKSADDQLNGVAQDAEQTGTKAGSGLSGAFFTAFAKRFPALSSFFKPIEVAAHVDGAAAGQAFSEDFRVNLLTANKAINGTMIVGNLVQSIQNALGRLKGLGSGLFDPLLSAAQKAVSGVATAFGSIGSRISGGAAGDLVAAGNAAATGWSSALLAGLKRAGWTAAGVAVAAALAAGVYEGEKAIITIGAQIGQALVGGLVASVKAQATAVGAAIKGVVDVSGSVLSGVGTAISGVANTVAGIGAAGAAATTALGASAIKTGVAYNALNQTARASFTTILGSTAAANTMMQQLTDFARSSPFPRQAFIEGTRTLLGFGVQAKDIIPIFTALQDAVAATGGSTQDLQDLTMVFSQIQAAGKITGVDLMQFAQRGVNAAELIGSQMGETGAQIKNDITHGSLDASDALAALTAGMEKRFGGAAANVKQTWVGATDRIKGAWRDVSAALVEPFISAGGGGLAVGWANSLGTAIRATIPTVQLLVKLFMDQFGPALAKIGPFIDHIGVAISQISPAGVSGVLDTLQQFLPVIGPIVGALGGIGSGLAKNIPIIGEFLPAMNPVLGAFIGLVASSKELREAFTNAFSAIMPALQSIGTAITPVVQTIATLITSTLVGIAPIITTVLGQLAATLAQVFTAIGPVLQAVATTVSATLTQAFLALGPVLNQLLPIVGQIAAVFAQTLGGLLTALGPTITALVPIIGQLAVTLGSGLLSVMQTLGPVITQLATVLGGAIVGVIQALMPAVQALVPVITQLVTAVGSGLAQVLTTLAPVLVQVAQLLGGVLAQAFTLLGPLITQIATILYPVVQSLFPVLATVVRALVPVISALLPVFAQLASTVLGALGTALQAIAPLFAQLVGALAPLISQLAGPLQSIVQALVPILMAFITPLVQLAQAVFPVLTTLVKALTPVLVQLAGIVAQVFQAFAPLIASLVGALLPIITALLPIIQILATAFIQVVQSLLPLLPALIPVIGLLVQLLTSVLKPIIPLITLLATIISGVLAAAFGILTPIISLITNVLSVLIGIISKVLSAFISVASSITSAVGSILTSVTNKLGDVISFLQQFPSKIIGFFSDAGTWLLDTGKNLIQGLIDGIKSIGNKIKDALLDLIPGPLKKFASALGISSPSTIFYGYGQNVVQGFVNGLSDVDAVDAAIQNMVPGSPNGITGSALSSGPIGFDVNIAVNDPLLRDIITVAIQRNDDALASRLVRGARG